MAAFQYNQQPAHTSSNYGTFAAERKRDPEKRAISVEVFRVIARSERISPTAEENLNPCPENPAARMNDGATRRIAERNGCEGPWTATMNAVLALNPERLGMQNRTQLSLSKAIRSGPLFLERVLFRLEGIGIRFQVVGDFSLRRGGRRINCLLEDVRGGAEHVDGLIHPPLVLQGQAVTEHQLMVEVLEIEGAPERDARLPH